MNISHLFWKPKRVFEFLEQVSLIWSVLYLPIIGIWIGAIASISLISSEEQFALKSISSNLFYGVAFTYSATLIIFILLTLQKRRLTFFNVAIRVTWIFIPLGILSLFLVLLAGINKFSDQIRTIRFGISFVVLWLIAIWLVEVMLLFKLPRE